MYTTIIVQSGSYSTTVLKFAIEHFAMRTRTLQNRRVQSCRQEGRLSEHPGFEDTSTLRFSAGGGLLSKTKTNVDPTACRYRQSDVLF